MAAGDKLLLDSDVTDKLLLDSDVTDVLLLEEAGAASFIPYPAPRYALNAGMQSQNGGMQGAG